MEFMLLSLLFSTFVAAQNLAPSSAPATSGTLTKDGVAFVSSDPFVDLRFRFRIQNRMTFEDYDSESSDKDVSDFAVRRLRLRLDGKVVDPRFGFNLQLSFTRGDMDWDTINFPAVVRDAVIYWKWSEHDMTMLGLRKLPGNRQRVISSGQQELIERSLANATFNLDRDIGVHSWHRFFEERPFWIKVAATGGEGRSRESTRAGLSYTARAEWLALGEFKNGGDYFEGDLEYETTPKVSIGAVYNSNFQAERDAGTIGSPMAGEFRNIENFIADFLLKYQGWSLSAEFFRRWSQFPEITPTQTIFNGQGTNLQLSYTTANHWAPVARWTHITPDEMLRPRLDERQQYTVGLGKYFNDHRVKAQADITLEQQKDFSANATLTNMIYRLQLEVGI